MLFIVFKDENLMPIVKALLHSSVQKIFVLLRFLNSKKTDFKILEIGLLNK